MAPGAKRKGGRQSHQSPPTDSFIVNKKTPTTSVNDDSSIFTGDLSVGYKYKPLDKNIDTIRLLVLQPVGDGEDKSIVRCELIHTTFREKPVYEALSYTWGDGHPTSPIFIDGTQVHIRQNLQAALHDLRWETKPRLLWADAICIDQNSLEERTYQVGIMDHIYSRASMVLVWLGRRPLHSQDINFNSPGSKVLNFFPNSDSRHELLSEWVCTHRYWRRLWIIQEIGLAKSLRVYIGIESMIWDAFVVLLPRYPMMFMAATGWANYNEGLELIDKLASKRRGRHSDSNRLETLLEDFQYAQCAESRDKIYGLLGLAHDCEDRAISVDYSKIPYHIYSDVISYFTQKRLLRSGATNDFDRSMRLIKFSQLVQKLLDTSYRETDTLPMSRTLVKIRGAFVGNVIHVGPTYDEILSSASANRRWRLSFADHYQLPQDVLRRREANEAYLGTLLGMTPKDAAKISNAYPNDKGKFWSEGYQSAQWEGISENWDLVDPDPDTDYSLPDANESMTQSSICTTSQPHMFLGSNFLMGLVASNAKIGDIICQFWQTDVAALLRKEDNIYRVVGRVHLCTGKLIDLEPVYEPWNEIPKDADGIILRLALDTLSLLTC